MSLKPRILDCVIQSKVTKLDTAFSTVPNLSILSAARDPVLTTFSFIGGSMQTLRVGIAVQLARENGAYAAFCKAMRDNYDMAVVTNDIYTQEDAQFLHKPRRWRKIEYLESKQVDALTQRFARMRQ